MPAILLVLLAVSLAAYAAAHALRPWYIHWGATAAERVAPIPGLERFERAGITSTHAITIHAPPSAVWPWLVQMGSGRGGCYSYSWLENLVGCQIRNADRILPEFQDLKEGDGILLHPKAPPVKVVRLDKEKVLALDGWVFHLKPLPEGRTRLITRTYTLESRPDASRVARLIDASTRTVFFDVLHFIMGRKQLLGIKRRAEHGGRPVDVRLRWQ